MVMGTVSQDTEDSNMVDAGAFARRLSLEERFHKLAVAVDAGPHVRQRNADHLGVAFGFAGHFHETRSGLEDRVIGRLVAVRPESGHPKPDDVGLQRFHGFIIDAQLLVVSGKLVRRKNVDFEFLDQAVKNLLAFRIRQVEAERFLARVDAQEIGIHAIFAQDVISDQSVGVPVDRVFQPVDLHPVLGQSEGQIGQDRGLFQRQNRDVLEYIHGSPPTKEKG
jgi:hypothetical protein